MTEHLVTIRHHLHKYPELPGKESETAAYITGLLEKTSPDELWTEVGGKGVIAFYKGKEPGKLIGVRAELDALPVTESNDFAHKSLKDGISHSCGHDGHMAIAIGVADYVSRIRSEMSGNVAVLFQPEEETGTGAAKMFTDDRLSGLSFACILALHNLPGFKKNNLVIKKGNFTSTTTGMIIRLWGATSHAGQPDKGNSPVTAMTSLIHSLSTLPPICVPVNRSALVTIIHARLGEVAFGTSPGYAHVMCTMRAHEEKDLEAMKSRAIRLAEGIARTHDLRYETEWVESYPAVINDDSITEEIILSAKELKIDIDFLDNPFSWSEDFSLFLQRYPGALFGLGSGINSPDLHNENYDFPDELLETGVKIFCDLIEKMLVGK